MATKQDVETAFAIYFPSGDPIDVKHFFSPWFIWRCTINLREPIEFELDIPKKIFKAICLNEHFRKRLLEECHLEGLVRRRPKGFRTPRGTLVRCTNYGWKLECVRGPYKLSIDIADESVSLFAVNIQWPHIFIREVLNGTLENLRFYWTNVYYELIKACVPQDHSGTVLFVNVDVPEDAEINPRSYSLIVSFIESFSSQADSWLINRLPNPE